MSTPFVHSYQKVIHNSGFQRGKPGVKGHSEPFFNVNLGPECRTRLRTRVVKTSVGPPDLWVMAWILPVRDCHSPKLKRCFGSADGRFRLRAATGTDRANTSAPARSVPFDG